MENIYSAIQELQLDLFQVFITGLLLFLVGYWLGTIKSKKFVKRIHKMEKEIMDLNSELLYNTTGSPLSKASNG